MCAMAALLALVGCQSPGGSGTTAQAPTAGAVARCAAPPQVAPGAAGPGDWPVYHRTADRHGLDGDSPPAKGLAPLWGLQLDGAMFAEPLVYKGMVVAATEHNTVYGLDDATGCAYWQTSLGPSFDSKAHALRCGNIPELGVTSTPVIDPQTATAYVVAYLDPGRFEMVALDLTGGEVRWRHGIDLPNSDVLYQLNRPALALANGRAYASFGGRAGDCGNYHGFVVGVRLDGSGRDAIFQVSPNREGAIWAPGGPVVLPNGDLLVATGNTDSLQQYDRGNSVIRLTPALEAVDTFAPPNWAHLNEIDMDLGSVNPTLLDDGGVFQIGKEGTGYLLSSNHLGGIDGQVYRAAVGDHPSCYAIGATAYASPTVYVPCDHGLTAVQVQGSGFTVGWRSVDIRSGSPIVAGGLVWVIDFERGYLFGLDRSDGKVRQKVQVGVAEHFVSLSASAGRLYLPVHDRLLAFSFT
jgi:outer membrane protein assembly factor BamB